MMLQPLTMSNPLFAQNSKFIEPVQMPKGIYTGFLLSHICDSPTPAGR